MASKIYLGLVPIKIVARPPTMRLPNQRIIEPVWYKGERKTKLSSCRLLSLTQLVMAADSMFLWVSRIGLGTPVVPEVK